MNETASHSPLTIALPSMGMTMKAERGHRATTLLWKLVKQRKFRQVEDLLRDEQMVNLEEGGEGSHSSFLRKNRVQESLEFFQGQTPLHSVMKYHPTGAVVEIMIHKLQGSCPAPPQDALDLRGRTPLHCSIQEGCEVAVIEKLMERDPTSSGLAPVMVPDVMNRLPLHYACLPPRRPRRSILSSLIPGKRLKKKEVAAIKQLSVIRSLVQAYPEASMVQDSQGMTPLELAVEHKADPRILELLEAIPRKVELPTTSKEKLSKKVRIRELDLQVYDDRCFGTKDLSMEESDDTGSSSLTLEGIPEEVAVNIFTSSFSRDWNDDISSLGNGGLSMYRKKNRMYARTQNSHFLREIVEL